MTQTLHILKPNDILFTKDGRKSGNLVIIEILDPDLMLPTVVAISDYGNIIKFIPSVRNLTKQFYLKTGATTPTHKYHDYKLNYPEYSI